MRLQAPGKSITLPAVRSNEGVRMAYQRSLVNLIDGLHAALVKAVMSVYPDLPNIAQDYATEKQLHEVMNQAALEWRKNIVGVSKDIAKKFVNSSMKATDTAFYTGLRNAGFSVRPQITPYMQVALDKAIEENVGLIRSIGEQHHADVQRSVMESVQEGRSMKKLTDDLQHRYGVTKRRAALIARDQNNKATAKIIQSHQQHFGITTAKWSHTSASKVPRPEHEEWNGESYNIDAGMWSEEDQEFVWPGTAINCGCTSRSIIPGFDTEEESE